MNSVSVIGRGQAGWHSQGFYQGNACSSSGGTLEHYLTQAIDGVPVYDAENADSDAFITFVFRAPLVDVKLEPGQFRKFMGRESLIAQANTSTMGSMDYVAVDVYLELLRSQVPGVRFGTVKDGAVIWEK